MHKLRASNTRRYCDVVIIHTFPHRVLLYTVYDYYCVYIRLSLLFKDRYPPTPGIDDLSGACLRGTRSLCTDRRPPIAGDEARAARYRENISPKPLPPSNTATRRQDPNADGSEEKRARLFAQRL